jgi:predicted 3-demethylubiquinone-9 3-methyltransferase (glyoxalase superfamily)
VQKIVTFLWFDHQAEEAARFYTTVFADAHILSVTRSGEAGPGPKGSVMTVDFQLEGQAFMALNGGPQFKFSEAVSLLVHCSTQEEIDRLWAKLTEGGEDGACGWLKDKYGLSWQLTPTLLLEWMRDADPEKAARVTRAMLNMRKFDLEGLRRAHEGR